MRFPKIDDPIWESQLDSDVPIGLEEGRDDRQHVQAAEYDRRGDNQVSLRGAVLARGGALGFVDLLEDTLACLHVGSTRIGQRKPTGRPVEQPPPEMRLQIRNLAA